MFKRFIKDLPLIILGPLAFGAAISLGGAIMSFFLPWLNPIICCGFAAGLVAFIVILRLSWEAGSIQAEIQSAKNRVFPTGKSK